MTATADLRSSFAIAFVRTHSSKFEKQFFFPRQPIRGKCGNCDVISQLPAINIHHNISPMFQGFPGSHRKVTKNKNPKKWWKGKKNKTKMREAQGAKAAGRQRKSCEPPSFFSYHSSVIWCVHIRLLSNLCLFALFLGGITFFFFFSKKKMQRCVASGIFLFIFGTNPSYTIPHRMYYLAWNS